MKDNITRREDYRPYPYDIPEIQLEFDLDPQKTVVTSVLKFVRVAVSGMDRVPMVLKGENLKTLSAVLDGMEIAGENIREEEGLLTLENLPEEGILTFTVEIDPAANSELMGLYYREDLFCTQNEAEGFRRITWHPDRPDVLSVFTVTLRGDRKTCPILLSNGNPVGSGDLPHGRHYAEWHDPFPKPSYLFALVAGDLEEVSDRRVTGSGRKIDLRIFVNHGSGSRAGHAMASLKRAMEWDEKTYGLEYDLDLFMIVAVDSFNMGAMENKGLNIYNSSLVLADSETATDLEILMIERVVAHEYFHNYTGNRVTCRDWFQLTLKEGLTVYRDEEYISDMTSRPGIRIDVVRNLKNGQFPEDGGALAHPVRPDSYRSIDNFYTSTVYQKGKEVIRMIETLIGRNAFVEGLKLYLTKNDGRAARVEDFLEAMEEVSGQDLTQFRLWYSQAGTPLCRIVDSYDGGRKEYRLQVSQSCRPTAESREKKPFVIPLKLGLLSASGEDLLPSDGSHSLLKINAAKETFVFKGIEEKPVPSLFRDFSAPVNYEYPYSREDLIFLMEKDSNGYNRFDAGQRLAESWLLDGEGDYAPPREMLEPFSRFFDLREKDPAFCAKILTLPGVDYLARKIPGYPVVRIDRARKQFIRTLAQNHEKEILACYEKQKEKISASESEKIGRRALKNVCLSYLTLLKNEYREVAFDQYEKSDNMTDVLGALEILVKERDSYRDKGLESFIEKWKKNEQVLNKWFSLQARADCPGVLDDIGELETHPLFDESKPSRIRALFGAFTANLTQFHASDGSGYRFLGEKIALLDGKNSHLAASLAKTFQIYPMLKGEVKTLLAGEIDALLQKESLSIPVSEILNRIVGEKSD